MILPRIAKIVAILLVTSIVFGIAVEFMWRMEKPTARQAVPSQLQTTSHTQPEDANLDFPEPIIDLGSRKGVVEHRFIFHNRGAQAITLGKIVPSCSCTLIEPDRTEIAPGEKGSFGVKVDLAKEQRGFKRYLIDVNYKSDGQRRKWLELVVNNDPDVQVLPFHVTLSGIAGDAVNGRFTVIEVVVSHRAQDGESIGEFREARQVFAHANAGNRCRDAAERTADFDGRRRFRIPRLELTLPAAREDDDD